MLLQRSLEPCGAIAGRRFMALAIVSTCLLGAGCHQPAGELTDNRHESTPATTQNEPAQIVAASMSSSQDSPAAIPKGNRLSMNSSPEKVCQVFLRSLQSGDQISAQQLLTERAIIETSKANLELASPGSPDAVFEILPARYDTLKKRNAHVDCLVRQTPDAANHPPIKLTWILRRNSSGWKISGMAVSGDEDSIDMLSFENPIDVARIKNSVSDGDTAAEQRQAQSPRSDGHVK